MLRTDASNCEFGAAFSQQHHEKLYPVAFVGTKLTFAERRYSLVIFLMLLCHFRKRVETELATV